MTATAPPLYIMYMDMDVYSQVYVIVYFLFNDALDTFY